MTIWMIFELTCPTLATLAFLCGHLWCSWRQPRKISVIGWMYLFAPLLGAVATYFCFRYFSEQDLPATDAILRMEDTSERTSIAFIWCLEFTANWFLAMASEPLIWAMRCYRRMHEISEEDATRVG